MLYTPQKTIVDNDQNLVERIMTQLTPLILRSVPTSSMSNDNSQLSLSQGELYHTKDPSSFNVGSSDNELVDAILAQLTPHIEGSITGYLNTEYASSNPKPQSKIGSSTEESNDKNERNFINSIISNLTPHIQTLVASSLDNGK